MTSPRDYGVPHDTWRPKQESTVEKILEPRQESTQILIAPTGSGKSTVATALGRDDRVVAVMESKVLQVNQYRGYGFEPLMGRGNYRCVNDVFPNVKMCDMCPHLPRMTDCSVADACIYLDEKAVALSAQRASFNYALFLAMYDTLPSTSRYVLDEGHILPDLVIHHSGITVSESDVKRFKLPDIPQVHTTDDALYYLERVGDVYEQTFDHLKNRSRSRTESELFSIVERKMRDVESTIRAMTINSHDWYFEDTGEELIIMPLTAKYHAPGIFNWEHKRNLIMSATIGNTNVFAEELGIKSFGEIELPHQYHKQHRPIYDLRSPRIGYSSKPSAYKRWASIIASFISKAPPNWGGVILVNSKAQANMLKELLSTDGVLARRLFVANPRVGTDSQMRQWNHFKGKQIGAINISWSMWQGVSFDDERICIIAKTPFPMMTQYETARKDYNSAYFSQRVAQKLAQGLGRTRRSSRDYDTQRHTNGLVGIADGNWYIVKHFLPTYLQQAVRRL